MEQQYSKGDIVVCKKSYKNTNDNFIANKKYVITNVSSESVSSESISVGEDYSWRGNPKFMIKNNRNFFCRRIYPGRKSCVDPVFKDYFFTVKESRKQKLIKLKRK